jgi:hypothetical protein
LRIICLTDKLLSFPRWVERTVTIQYLNTDHLHSFWPAMSPLPNQWLWWMTCTSKHQLFSIVSNIMVEPLTYVPIHTHTQTHTQVYVWHMVILPVCYYTWNIPKTINFTDNIHYRNSHKKTYNTSLVTSNRTFSSLPPYILFQFSSSNLYILTYFTLNTLTLTIVFRQTNKHVFLNM